MKWSDKILAFRGVLAVGLTIGFYLMAIAIAVGLAWLAFHAWNKGQGFDRDYQTILVTLFGAAAVLWSIFPRVDRFEPPGFRLTEEHCPSLFAQLREVAQSAQQPLPDEVYLVADFNAWVAHVGGVLGWRGRRVMGLGLPLMQSLTVQELRAVLAHEFGHFHAGDTRLGPWIYKARSALDRATQALGGGYTILIWLPFIGYRKVFIWVTHAVSRRQEFLADARAARWVGARPLILGLETIHALGPAFEAFWFAHYSRILQAGYRPPLLDGFARFLDTPDAKKAVAENHGRELAKSRLDDTHPSLSERVAALAGLPEGPPLSAEPKAITLLGESVLWETVLLARVQELSQIPALKEIAWDHVGRLVVLPELQRVVARYRRGLAGLTPEALPELARNPRALRKRFYPALKKVRQRKDIPAAAEEILGAALALLFLDRDWNLEYAPGIEVAVRQGANAIEPFRVMGLLKTGELPPDAWRDRCHAAGVLRSDLAFAGAEDY